MRTSLRRTSADTLLFALLVAGLVWPAAAAAQRTTPTVVYVIRHAEKADDGSADPALTAAGEARARALAERMATVDLAAVYATQFRRTRSTATPAAQAAGVTVTVQPARVGQVAEDARALADRIRAEHQGGSVLVVGHSNTVPAILEALTGVSPGVMGDHDHDDLFIVELPLQGKPRGRLETLGTSTPAPAVPVRPGSPTQSAPSSGGADKKSVADAIETVIEARGIETAVRAYQELSKYSRNSYDFAEGELERLGRRYLSRGQALEAAIVFEMNASSYPNSVGVFLSLAEAYRARGETERAVAVYRHVLVLEPGNGEARRGLAELEG